MKKYLCLLTILLNTYGSDCETPNGVKERRDEIEKNIKLWKDEAQKNNRSSGHDWIVVNGLEEALEQFNSNPYSKQLAKKIGMEPIDLNKDNNVYNLVGSNENKKNCANVCTVVGFDNTLDCPVAHTCLIESGTGNRINCPWAQSCSRGSGSDHELICPNAL